VSAQLAPRWRGVVTGVRERVLALRVVGQRLDRRGGGARAARVLRAVGALGVRDVQGSAAVALQARVSGFRGEDLDAALGEGSVVEVASARGVATLVPATDVDVFTLGTLPADEASLRQRLVPVRREIDAAGWTATDTVARAVEAARSALAGGPLEIAALSQALTRALPEVSPMCRGRCGVEHIDTGIFDLVGESGAWRREDLDGAKAFTLLPEPSTPRREAREQLVRRYLAALGPSTVQQFADWCGIGTPDARESLAGDGDGNNDIAELDDGTYLLAADVDRLADPATVEGVRLLPPRDPYLDGRDRTTLVPDKTLQKKVWRPIPNVGLVLVDGDSAGTWNGNKTRSHLQLTVERLPGAAGARLDGRHDELVAKAEAIAALRGAGGIEVAAD
jgi:hypothetical protein